MGSALGEWIFWDGKLGLAGRFGIDACGLGDALWLGLGSIAARTTPFGDFDPFSHFRHKHAAIRLRSCMAIACME